MRRVLRIALAVLVALPVLAALALLALATPPGRTFLAGRVEAIASSDQMKLDIGRISGWPPFNFSIDRLTLSDPEGTFATVSDIAADLDARALLTGAVTLDSLSIGAVALDRLPETESGGEGGTPFIPSIRRLAIARVDLGEALAGRPAALAVSGGLVADRAGQIVARIEAERIDGTEGRFTLRADRPDGASDLVAAITADEAANGILAGLMGQPAGPAYKLDAEARAGGSGLAGTLDLSSPGDVRFNGSFSLSAAAESGRRIVLNGSGDPGDLVPASLANLLAGPIEIDIDADWEPIPDLPFPRIEVRRGTVSTAVLQARAAGTMGRAGSDLTLSIDAAGAGGDRIAIPLPGRPALGFDEAHLNGRIAPSNGLTRLDLTGNLAGLSSGDIGLNAIGLSFAIEADGDDPFSDEDMPFALRIEADAIETPGGTIAVEGGSIIIQADGSFRPAAAENPVAAEMRVGGDRLRFDGTASRAAIEGRAEAVIAELSAYAALVGRPVAGALSAAAEGLFLGAAGTDLSVAGRARDLDPGNAQAARLLAGETGFSLKLARQRSVESGTALSLSDVRVDGAAFDLAGALALRETDIEGRFEGGIGDLSRLADATEGALSFTAELSGSPARPDILSILAMPSGRLLDRPVENAEIRLSGSPSDEGWQGDLTLNGRFAGEPLEGAARARLEAASGRLDIPDIDLSIGGNRVTGAVERDGEGLLSGALEVDAPDIATLAALALAEATGTARATIRFAPEDGRQSVAAAFSGSGVSVAGLTAGRMNGDVRVADAFGTPLASGNATATAIRIGGTVVDRVEAEAGTENGATRFTARATGPDIALEGAGTLASDQGANVLSLTRLAGTARGIPLNLAEPVSIRFGGDGANLSGTRIRIGDGTITVSGAVSPALDLDIGIQNIAASLVNSVAPQIGASGSINGEARVTGTTGAPVVAWQARATAVSVAATRSAGLPGLAITANGRATLSETSLDGTISGAGLSLSVSGRAPYSGAGLDVTARGSAPLALAAVAIPNETRLGGTANLDFRVTGSTSAPNAAGVIGLSGATLADPVSGFGLTGVSGRIRLDGRVAHLEDLSGRIIQGGTLTAAGTVGIDPAAGLPADLRVRVADGRYSDGSVVNARFNADLALAGPLLRDGTLSGRVDLGRTEILIPDRLGGAATAIPVEHRNAAAGFRSPLAADQARAAGVGGGGSALRLDLRVNATSALLVRGFGIDAELGGAVGITGTLSNPVTIGNFEMRRGRMDVIGRRFVFSRGGIVFSGDLVPVLDFAADTRTSGGTVTLTVSGRADDPKIAFTSSAGLPEEEAVAQLLFDRPAGQLTPLQAVQLVDTLAQLSGTLARGQGIFDRLRQTTGLDDLDIRQTESGGTAVGIGRRINENLRVGVEQDTEEGTGRVTIDLDLTRDVKVRAEAGQDASGKLGITFEREY